MNQLLHTQVTDLEDPEEDQINEQEETIEEIYCTWKFHISYQPSWKFYIVHQPPRNPDLSHLGHIFYTSSRAGYFFPFTQSTEIASYRGVKSVDALFF